MSDVPRPQDTECTEVMFDSEGLLNGVLSLLTGFGYAVQYDEYTDRYYVGHEPEEEY